jgi:hypothetical protein
MIRYLDTLISHASSLIQLGQFWIRITSAYEHSLKGAGVWIDINRLR